MIMPIIPDLFVTPHAVEQFQKRIAPLDAAKARQVDGQSAGVEEDCPYARNPKAPTVPNAIRGDKHRSREPERVQDRRRIPAVVVVPVVKGDRDRSWWKGTVVLEAIAERIEGHDLVMVG